MNILPDISDTKNASYSPETVIGRSSPINTYSHSEARTISWTLHLIAADLQDIDKNLLTLRELEACVYPQTATGKTTYQPPPICKIRCGSLLADDELCVILKSYSVKFPTDTIWDDTTYMPYKLDIDLSFEVVYDSAYLPGADRIFRSGM